MTHLPEDIVANILTDKITEYYQLKKAVLDHLQANKHQLKKLALSALEIGDKRPSQLVSGIKKRFQEIGLKADDTPLSPSYPNRSIIFISHQVGLKRLSLVFCATILRRPETFSMANER